MEYFNLGEKSEAIQFQVLDFDLLYYPALFGWCMFLSESRQTNEEILFGISFSFISKEMERVWLMKMR